LYGARPTRSAAAQG